MTRLSRTKKTVKAAFSKSVSCASMVRSSTRQPMSAASAGGGFQRTERQLVLWMLSKCSVVRASSTAMRSEKMTSGSRTKRPAMWRASRSATPAARSVASASSSTASGRSLCASRSLGDDEIKASMDE